MKKISLILFLWLFAVSSFGQPTPADDDKRPGPRNQPAIAFDGARNRVVLFGGIDGQGTSLADTWEWDGARWSRIQTPNAPPARAAHALVYNAKRARVMLFGGTDFASRQTFNDTWEFDGKNWTQIKTDAPPEGRFHHALAYDARRQRVVLFGGNAAVPPLDSEKFKAGQRSDVWEFGDAGWVKIDPAVKPPARDHLALTYNAKTGKTILFGGFTGGFQDGVYLGDTWAWDGRRWEQLKPKTSPEARGGKPGMTYDSKRNRIVLFGGGTPQKAMNDMWFLASGEWLQNK